MTHWVHGFYELVGWLGYPHPIHPTQVHMVIGLLVGAMIFALVALYKQKPSLNLTARHCFLLAVVFVLPTILTGWMDWRHFLAGACITTVRAKIILSVLLLILLGLGLVLGQRERGNSHGLLAVYILCFFAVGGLGYLGGSLVYTAPSVRGQQDYATGKMIFEFNCAGCHPGGGNASDPRKPVKSSTVLKDYDTFESFLRDPPYPMPSYPSGDLSAEQVRELYDYLVRAFQFLHE